MKKILLLHLILISFCACAPSSYVGVKFYPPHNEWTPQPGAVNVGVDRWAIELHADVDIFSWGSGALFVGVNPEAHFMVDFPNELESNYGGNLRDITMRWHGGIRDGPFEFRVFHGYERWVPDARKYSRWLYTGVELRYYWSSKNAGY